MFPLADLGSLTPREAVADTLIRLLIGFDKNDVQLFSSAFAGEDVILELNGGNKRSLNSLSDIITHVFNLVGPMDSSHTIGNVRVDVKEGGHTAHLFAYVLAQHCQAGKGKDPAAPKYSTGGDYSVDFVKDEVDGKWKVKKFVLDVIWNQGDPSIMQNPV